jgi:hypothetical protein
MKEIELEILRSSNGKLSVYLNDYRIAGDKPLVSNNLIFKYTIETDRLKKIIKEKEEEK